MPRIGPYKIIEVAGVFLLTLPGGSTKRYRIEGLNDRPGLYFSKEFSFLLATEFWTIAIDTHLEHLEEKLTQLEAIWNETMALKNASLESTWTEAHFQQTRDNMKNTGLKIKRLYDVIGTEPVTTNRRKRGLFNTIGIGMKTLFGTMDNDDADYYNEKIATMDLNQHRVYQLERDQLTVVRHAISDITHTFKDFRTN
ncbi:hypothetical protein J6590_072117 [Homalodisca vitripennis]|nr:hypothetical protein J6590_072117 [Homalodisca vitripennis]